MRIAFASKQLLITASVPCERLPFRCLFTTSLTYCLRCVIFSGIGALASCKVLPKCRYSAATPSVPSLWRRLGLCFLEKARPVARQGRGARGLEKDGRTVKYDLVGIMRQPGFFIEGREKDERSQGRRYGLGVQRPELSWCRSGNGQWVAG